MSSKPTPTAAPASGPAAIVAPTAEEWRAMPAAERERFLVRVLDALSDPVAAMSEGRPHKKAKTRALDRLGLHFRAVGRSIYLAEEMAVLHPGEPAFTPDVLAVLDVVEPEDDPRMAWVVVDEGRGLDLVLEVLHHGDRDKDLVENVERYARHGIAEYFVYDRARQRIHGFRLSPASPGRYQRIVPQAGRYTSTVLGLDLAVTGGNLRFFLGEAELPGTADLLDRLHGMVEELNAKADRAEAEIAQAAERAAQAAERLEEVTGRVAQAVARADREAERAAQEAERAAREAERRAQEAERASQEAERASRAMEVLRSTLVALLEARGVAIPIEARARVAACEDPATLQRWILRASTAPVAAEALEALREA
jgi:Uma2 family endonuclease